jgi:hypothetical protein
MEYLMQYIILAYFIVSPILIYAIYRNGLRDGMDIVKEKTIKPAFNIPNITKKDDDISEDEKKMIEYEQAIMNYKAGGR